MAKAASPVRLKQDLMEAATLAGSILHRSAAEQVEYWADLGRKVANKLDPETLLAIQSGLTKITVEETAAVTPNPDDVFAALDRDRSSGALSEAISNDSIRYQASATHPGKLEQISPNGNLLIGDFINGEFVPLVIS
ncbi:MAG: hypothetical protein JKY50_04635 [Oleispira sp.]|nr:hypothetical protein [Oleispira sp.]